MRYKIIEDTLEHIEQTLDDFNIEGWVPQGGVTPVYENIYFDARKGICKEWVYVQAIILEETEDEMLARLEKAVEDAEDT